MQEHEQIDRLQSHAGPCERSGLKARDVIAWGEAHRAEPQVPVNRKHHRPVRALSGLGRFMRRSPGPPLAPLAPAQAVTSRAFGTAGPGGLEAHVCSLDFFTYTCVVRPSSGVSRANDPAHASLRQPRVQAARGKSCHFSHTHHKIILCRGRQMRRQLPQRNVHARRDVVGRGAVGGFRPDRSGRCYAS